MPTWKKIIIPETPSSSYVIVKNISTESSEKTVSEFFWFCGKILEFELIMDDGNERQIALIHFERDSAAKTATLLSDALIDNSHIVATHYFETVESEDEKVSRASDNSEKSKQELKYKSRIVAEILANGYILQDQVVAKGLEYDSKYNLSTRLSGYLSSLTSNVKQMDEKYRIWDKAVEMDTKFKFQEKAQTATQKFNAALQSPAGQKVHQIANQTLAQIAAVHYEAKKIQSEKITRPATASA